MRYNWFISLSLAFLFSSCLAAAPADPSVNDGLARHHHIVFSRERGSAESGPQGITPSEMGEIYGFHLVTNQGLGQVIGIVDAYDDPNIEADLAVFSTEFELPACTTSNGCFRKLYATGSKPVPSAGWAGEISLDVEWAHAVAPQARIVLVEAKNDTTQALFNAVAAAVSNGATVVSMSWGCGEFAGELALDPTFQSAAISYVASAGDSGPVTEYPAASPYVVSVGGTTLADTRAFQWKSESVWNTSLGATGGGVSSYEPEPSWQAAFQNQGNRGVPDLAYDADPATGVAVYNSFGEVGQRGWMQVGGTSAGAPQIAALIAIVNSSRLQAGKPPLHFPAALYSFPAGYHDIVTGSNGSCGTLCDALPGYDFTTGLGTPVANALINALEAR